jgi:hypothetical protein
MVSRYAREMELDHHKYLSASVNTSDKVAMLSEPLWERGLPLSSSMNVCEFFIDSPLSLCSIEFSLSPLELDSL